MTKVHFPAGGGNVGIFFLFAIASRPALGPIQPPVQLISWLKHPGREADLSPEVKNMWFYNSNPQYALTNL